MKTIYFGGSVRSDAVGGPLSYNEETDLDVLDEMGFRVAFHEWITQCWLHNHPVPNNAQSLQGFELERLIPEFRQRFAAGDWRRMVAGRGVTAEEYLLFLQLLNGQPLALALNREQPSQPLGRVRNKLLLSEYELGACLGLHLREAKVRALPKGAGQPVMLYDGRVGHVIALRAIDDDQEWISYDDPTWPGNRSMLCEGENEAGVEAEYLGQEAVGQWMVHLIQLAKVLYAVPVTKVSMQAWRECAESADEQLRQRMAELGRDWGLT